MLLSALLGIPEESARPVSRMMLVMSHCIESSSSSGMALISSFTSFSGLTKVSPKFRNYKFILELVVWNELKLNNGVFIFR